MDLFIIRGLPNSGKTTVAKQLAPDYNFAADDWWEKRAQTEGLNYTEVFKKYGHEMGRAHGECKKNVEAAMQLKATPIAVHNTFTRTQEMTEYFELAKKYGYRVHVMTVERAHNGDNGHDVPVAAVQRMVDRWQFVDPRMR